MSQRSSVIYSRSYELHGVELRHGERYRAVYRQPDKRLEDAQQHNRGQNEACNVGITLS